MGTIYMLTLPLKTTRIIYKKENLNNHSVAPTLCHGKEYSQITSTANNRILGKRQCWARRGPRKICCFLGCTAGVVYVVFKKLQSLWQK